MRIKRMTAGQAKQVDNIKARMEAGKRLTNKEIGTAIKFLGVKTYLGLKSGIKC